MLSLTHHYTFNDGDAADVVGGSHGVLRNGAIVVDGAVLLQNTGVTSGQASDVQYVELPSDLLADEGSATLEVWYTSGGLPNWARVFDFGEEAGDSDESYLFFTPQSGSNDSRAVYRKASSAETVASTASTDDGQQHVAAVVYDNATRYLRLYLDGVEQAATSLGRSGLLGSVNDATNSLGRSLFAADPGFTGLIDEFRIYDHALTPAEAAANAAAGPVVELLPGDYDRNRVVDTADHVVWAASYGSTTELDADGNQDGVVDAADYSIWRDNLGAGEPDPADQILINESLTVDSLSSTVIELTGQSELHISHSRGVIVNSEVRLNSPDAWLFLHNVKPSNVDGVLLGQLRVDGAPALPGINLRIVQHGLGAVLIPHSVGFEPLEAFAGMHFTGESKTFEQYSYHDSPGEFGVVAGDLSSFKLKRGYMATLATQANGGGFSQVFVAQDYDLEISILPTGMDNEVRFVRVLPWRWVSKKGASDISPVTLDAAWFYNWNNSAQSTLDYEYVPIKQQRYWPGNPTNNTDVTHWLGFNEPNNPVEDAYTSLGNGSVDNAVAYYATMQTTGHRIGSPAVTDGGKAWLYEFMDKALAQGLRIDYIAIHNYQANHSATSLKAWLKDIYDRYHLPIWVTEFNNGANWTGNDPASNAANAAVIDSFIQMMDDTPWIERYSIYSRVEAVRELTYSDGSLTPTGVVYEANESPIGYTQEIAAPASAAGGAIAQLNFDGDTLDSSGYGLNGHAFGVPRFVAGVSGQALEFDGVDDRIQLPTGVASGDSFSFAGWVKWNGGGNWQRIFDFGKDTDSFLFLTPSNGSTMRFGIKNHGSQQIVETTPLTVGEWTHVAVTLGGSQARMYVDGALVDTNNAATLRPSVLGVNKNYLGDSQYAHDPSFNGQLDEVLFTDYVLTQSQILALMSGNQAPVVADRDVDGGSVMVGATYSFPLASVATDAEGATITYSIAHGPGWASIDSRGVLNGTPNGLEVGANQFVVVATDDAGAVSYAVVSVEVNEFPPFAFVTSKSGLNTVTLRGRPPARATLIADRIDQAMLLVTQDGSSPRDSTDLSVEVEHDDAETIREADDGPLQIAFAAF
ncbi:Glycosyl hydrolase catalytic core [Botrimarina colliarenosi]|uniref:Glycosyl hydrolase catalytic core n=1 Tax=Botrimarina colliarenosi TaxID=2528001 RepID=A0A5C6A3V0_9BACT|nr:LamG-like jellyroll fold domain-containing protein [Botrimarina colliarenosi]TWT94017.1 Glycosyl hydrolase catalytic core [Botrimarina colliarenosi]